VHVFPRTWMWIYSQSPFMSHLHRQGLGLGYFIATRRLLWYLLLIRAPESPVQAGGYLKFRTWKPDHAQSQWRRKSPYLMPLGSALKHFLEASATSFPELRSIRGGDPNRSASGTL